MDRCSDSDHAYVLLAYAQFTASSSSDNDIEFDDELNWQRHHRDRRHREATVSIWGSIKHAVKRAAEKASETIGVAGGDLEDNAKKQDDTP